MANLTLDHIKTIVQSILAGVTRYKPNLTVTDPDDPRYVVGAERMSKRVDAAQSTADAAQSTADAAQSTADAAIGFENISYTLQFDQDTIGRDTFVYNAWHYYKVSDFTCPLSALVSMTGTNLAGETDTGYIDANKSCVYSMLWFIVNNAGKISVNGESFTAPSTGLYALYSEPKTGWAYRERYCADTVTISYETVKIKLRKYSLGVSESGVMMVKDADGNVIPQPDTEAREMAETAQSTAQTAQSAADAIKATGADWDQNDSTALDYIRNRTHYSVPTQTVKCDTEVVSAQISQSIAGSGTSSTEMYVLKTDAPLPTAEDIIGARVTINDVTYTITSEDILKNSSTVYACKYLPNRDWTQSAGIVAFFVNTGNYPVSASFSSGLNNAYTAVTLPHRGVYFTKYGTTIEYGGEVVPLDEKYLPLSVTDGIKSAQTAASNAQETANKAQADVDKLNAEYTLIETITLDEATEAVIRTTEPDGKALNLDALYMTITCPAIEDSRTIVVTLGSTNDENLWDSAGRFAYFAGTMAGTSKLMTTIRAEKTHGFFHPIMIAPSAASSPKGLQGFNGSRRTGTIKAVRVFAAQNTTNEIPAGTTIEIWGVRADA